MNERIYELSLIDELAFQSGITQHSFSDPRHPDLDGFVVSQEKLDKFVELIVRECADYITESASIETLLGKKLLEHFGVEE